MQLLQAQGKRLIRSGKVLKDVLKIKWKGDTEIYNWSGEKEERGKGWQIWRKQLSLLLSSLNFIQDLFPRRILLTLPMENELHDLRQKTMNIQATTSWQ